MTESAVSTASDASSFVDRRANPLSSPPGFERRQFANSHDELSDGARELAVAIDEYKLKHRRRFISYEEIYAVIQQLGYRKTSDSSLDCSAGRGI